MQDSEIIKLFLTRDEQAISQTRAAYGKRLDRLSYRIVGSLEDAEECVSDTYLRTWNTIPPEKPKYFFAFLAKICRNLSLDRLDYLGTQKRHGQIVVLTQELEECIPAGGREFERAELGQVLNAFLKSLTQENRNLFLRRYWFGDSVQEIAADTGLRVGVVSTRLYRLRGQLAKHLQKEEVFL